MKIKKRRYTQLITAVLYNCNIKGFMDGTIYKGSFKGICTPGLNCYSCSGAIASCPLGSLQSGLLSSKYKVPYYILGTLLLFGLILGRFICGFLTDRFGDRKMIRYGLCGIAAGVALVLLPLPKMIAPAGLVLIGFGCAPVYPCQIHATPELFGKEQAQRLIGLQMASAYIGTTLMPPLFGVIADHAGLGMFPVFLAFFLAALALMTEQLYAPKK